MAGTLKAGRTGTTTSIGIKRMLTVDVSLKRAVKKRERLEKTRFRRAAQDPRRGIGSEKKFRKR